MPPGSSAGCWAANRPQIDPNPVWLRLIFGH
jgi:hypothetical protein